MPVRNALNQSLAIGNYANILCTWSAIVMRSLRWIRGSGFARHEIGLYSDVRNALITVQMVTP